jgi:glycosyltransferase involved in cell wall biosynthesis
MQSGEIALMSTVVTQEEFGGTEKPVNQIRPLISVRLLTFNNCAYIAQSIDSALMQVTDFPFEIVIGEDDSTDGTREICIDYARRYPDKIRLFLRREQDKIIINGTRTSRHNFVSTLAACRAPFIALLDGDDYWTDPSKLQKEVDELNRDPSCAMVFHDAAEADSTGRILRKSVLPENRKRNLSAEELSLGAAESPRPFVSGMSYNHSQRNFSR